MRGHKDLTKMIKYCENSPGNSNSSKSHSQVMVDKIANLIFSLEKQAQ